MRIIELFSGIGSQAKAFAKLNIDFEVAGTCEWDIHAIVAYDLIHNGPGILPGIAEMTKDELIAELSKYTLSSDGKTPLTKMGLKTLHLQTLRAVYSGIRKTNNYVNVTELDGKTLPSGLDMITYSFPCQDLSNVGAFHGYTKGIDRNANTRSGMLWEVERILRERLESDLDLPRFLLLENVSALQTKPHIKHFEEWKSILSSFGYYNHVYCLNANDFGLPQNRFRLLMLSVRIDNKYTAAIIKSYFKNHNLMNKHFRDTLGIHPPILSNYLKIDYSNPQYRNEAEECQPNSTESRKRIWNENLQITDNYGNIIADKVATITTKQDRHPNSGNLYVDFNNGKGSYRYLTPRECLMLMGFDENDYQTLIDNPIKRRKDCLLLTRDKIIRLAGNSIAVNVLMAIFRQTIELNEAIEASICGVTMDIHDKETRSRNMAQIKSKGNKPEDIVCKYLFGRGFRYRKNDSKLPGSPDIVLKKYKTAIFVNGCFWHKHDGCLNFTWPKSNVEFWRRKIERNVLRDKENIRALEASGWRVIVIWECELQGGKRAETLKRIESEITLAI